MAFLCDRFTPPVRPSAAGVLFPDDGCLRRPWVMTAKMQKNRRNEPKNPVGRVKNAVLVVRIWLRLGSFASQKTGSCGMMESLRLGTNVPQCSSPDVDWRLKATYHGISSRGYSGKSENNKPRKAGEGCLLTQLPKGLQHVVFGILAASLAATDVMAQAAPNPGGQRQREVFGSYTSTQIVVKLRPEAMATPAAQQHFQTARHDADPRAALSGALRSTAGDWRATRMRRAYSEPFGDPALAAKHGLDRTFIIEVPQGTDTETMAAAFSALNLDVEVAAVDGIGGVADFIPNDTSFNVQYALHNTGGAGRTADADIDAPAAWDLHTGDFGTVTIAIIDSGVNSHTDYGNNVGPFPNGRFVQGRNTDNPLTPTLTTDGCPHGTHVAGIAAATGNNGLGVAGVTWGAYIMPIRVLGFPNGCSGLVSNLATGITWAADHGADVGNISLQYYNITLAESTLLQDAINYAHDLGMILIAAAGNRPNCPLGVVAYPAKMSNCMGVSATTDDDLFADASTTGGFWSSCYGNEVDVCAPGDLIRSTWTSNGYAYSSGTSMATPHVSGLAALMKSYVPELTNEAIEVILMDTADDKGPAGWDDHYGFGRINAHSALLAAEAWPWQLCGNGVIDGDEECDPGPDVFGDCCNSICRNIPVGGVCRSAAGACDVAETCIGSPPTCPADVKSTAQCRAAAGVCDISEFCDGVGNACPADAKSTAQCRGSAGVCDIADFCNGVTNNCPADAKSTAQCRGSAGVCDPAEFCNGVSNTCPADTRSTAECRASTGVCDPAEDCDGLSADCPTDSNISDCVDADGCCPPGCDLNNDDDCAPVTVTKWESVLTHSPNQPVPIALEIADTGLFTEPRSGIMKIVITFDGAISAATAVPENVTICGNDLSDSPVDLSGVQVSTATTAGDTMLEIDFTPGLPNFARYRITINTNIQSAAGASIEAGAGGLSRILTALQGDYSDDVRVNATDLGGVRGLVGTNPINANLLNHVRADANNDGRINATDLGLVRGRVGQDARAILDPVCP